MHVMGIGEVATIECILLEKSTPLVPLLNCFLFVECRVTLQPFRFLPMHQATHVVVFICKNPKYAWLKSKCNLFECNIWSFVSEGNSNVWLGKLNVVCCSNALLKSAWRFPNHMGPKTCTNRWRRGTRCGSVCFRVHAKCAGMEKILGNHRRPTVGLRWLCVQGARHTSNDFEPELSIAKAEREDHQR